MKTEHHNKLTEAELELLAFLAEELGEAVQMVGKALRHGLDSRSPNKPPDSPDTRELLATELGHVEFVVDLLKHHEILSFAVIRKSKIGRANRPTNYFHHQPSQQGL